MNIYREGGIDLMRDRRGSLKSLTYIPTALVEYETDFYSEIDSYWTLFSCDKHGTIMNGASTRRAVIQDGTSHYLLKEGEVR